MTIEDICGKCRHQWHGEERCEALTRRRTQCPCRHAEGIIERDRRLGLIE